MYRKDERVQEARQRQRKCCFCIHLRPGVFILLFLHVLLSIALFSITGFFLINVSWLFISNLVLYSIFAIGFFLGVMGVLNNVPLIYLTGPITSIFYMTWGIVWSIYVVNLASTTPAKDLKLYLFELSSSTQVHVFYTLNSLHTVLQLYFLYVLFNYYGVLRKRKKRNHLKTYMSF